MSTANTNAGGWRQVQRRKTGHGGHISWDVAVGEGKRGASTVVSSFFITEFGEGWRASDLLFELKDFGDIVEVVIPAKRDKRGRRYCFARFANVADVQLLATKL